MSTVETNGIETYYEDHGEGQPIVFIHGATSDRQLWGQQVEALRDEYRVITYDMRDHGLTESSPHEYTVEVLADDLQALLDALDLEEPVICGLSLGGMVAQYHAVSYPNEAAGYVFADTYTPEWYSLGETLLFGWYGYGYYKIAETLGYNRIRGTIDRISTLVFDEENAPDEETADELREESVDLTDEEAVRILKASQHWFQLSLDYTEITAPVLALYGEHEPDFIKSHIGRMSTGISDFRAHELEDAGHNAHVDAPEAFVSHLRDFLIDRGITTAPAE